MLTISTTLETPVHRSFRVAQVAGMFDVTFCNQVLRSFKCDLPDVSEDWQIGLIVGPSGSGKTTIASAAFGDAVYAGSNWPRKRAMIDGFGDMPIKRIIRALTAVGLSSPPSWLKPYHVLSTGERFRCDLARALLSISDCKLQISDCEEERTIDGSQSEIPLIVFDEFTSVVDRNVARVCSAAVARHIRRDSGANELPKRFVAVTCHYDVAEWLEPDWIADMATGQLSRRRLRRPPLELLIHRASREAWPTFAPHHYLSGELHHSARCYVGVLRMPGALGTIGPWDDRTIGRKNASASGVLNCEFPGPIVPSSYGPTVQQNPIAFAATLQMPGHRRHRRFHRLVVLPDYQGIGIGGRFLDAVAELHREEGLRINIATGHPAIIARCRASPRWRTVRVSRYGRLPKRLETRTLHHSFGRPVVSFEFDQ